MSSVFAPSGLEPESDQVVRSPVHDILVDLHETFRGLRDGEVATYIPELAKADPDWFGICLATPDGQIYEVGDTSVPFTIQSISKPFVYAAALAHHGPAAVFRKVGVEPSGDAFNAISLDPVSGRPANPMINAGAIAMTGLLPGKDHAEMCSHMLQTLSKYAGRPLTVSHDVYVSERDTGFRNHAIAFMLRNAGVLESDPVGVADIYFRQCSVEVTCRDLAVMAAMLASGGVNPVSGERVMEPWCVESVLSVMATCGMYDFSGEWMFDVGLPAKSGVSGGILTVLPGRLGVAIFSPPLDPKGNSVRGMEVCRALSRSLDLHLFNSPVGGRTVVHRHFTGADISSNRVRSAEGYALLKEHGKQTRIYELQGDVSFSTAEIVVRDIVDAHGDGRFTIVDLSRVTSLNGPSCTLFAALARMLSQQQRRLLFTHIKPDFAQALGSALRGNSTPEERLDHPSFEDVDHALEWCENAILDEAIRGAAAPARTEEPEAAGMGRFALLKGLTQEELGLIGKAIQKKSYAGGELIVQSGAGDRYVYLLERGEASAVITLRGGQKTRLATFSAGMSFGEVALLGQRRSATVCADGVAECLVLDVEEVSRIWFKHSRIKAVMMENLAADLGQKLWRTNETISIFAQ